jgi:hypothetical protein
MARILAEIRANRILPSPGTRVSRGPHGTHISVEIPKHASASAADKGCWCIVAEKIEVETGGETATATVHYIDRQYYQVGGLLQKGDDRTTMESLVEANTPFVAARISHGGGSADVHNWYGVQIRGYESFEGMQDDSQDRRWSVIPLYELKLPDRSGESEGAGQSSPPPIVVVQDFRAIPIVQAFEMSRIGGAS